MQCTDCLGEIHKSDRVANIGLNVIHSNRERCADTLMSQRDSIQKNLEKAEEALKGNLCCAYWRSKAIDAEKRATKLDNKDKHSVDSKRLATMRSYTRGVERNLKETRGRMSLLNSKFKVLQRLLKKHGIKEDVNAT